MARTSPALGLLLTVMTAGCGSEPAPRPASPGELVEFVDLLPPRPGNPRNTEGDFIQLADGRLLFAYTKFTGGGSDYAEAHIAARYSSDGGTAWTDEDVVIVPNEGLMNTMSVSLVRLQSGAIALFYLVKNDKTDLRPYVRFSSDEGETWSDPIVCIEDEGYFVLNNDRVVQLESGRLVMPVALHVPEGEEFNRRGIAMFYLSDDDGRTWRRSNEPLECPTPSPAGFQEPGVVELKDGRVMMFARTRMGSQWVAYSSDGAETWSQPEASALASPQSPATIERLPWTGDLLAVWNDHSNVPASYLAVDGSGDGSTGGLRTPLTAAVSRDEGKTWEFKQNLHDDPEGWYCYTAMAFVGDDVLLGYVAGGEQGLARLSRTRLARIPWQALYWK